jgi:hypothetical protein
MRSRIMQYNMRDAKVIMQAQLEALHATGIEGKKAADLVTEAIRKKSPTPDDALRTLSLFQEVIDEMLAEAVGTAVSAIRDPNAASTARHNNWD